jgi:oligopeptide transport system substrate-binding protein
MRRFPITISSIFLALACANPIAADTPGGDPAELVIHLAADELTMDPLHAYSTTELQIATGIYEGLVVYHPESLRPMPGAAYRWEISEEGTVYRFHLRERGRFSNGDPVTAADFRDSWLRIIDPADEGEYSFLFDVISGVAEYRSGAVTDPGQVGLRVIDEYTFEVELAEPASHFLAMLCHMTFAPIHRRYRESRGWETEGALVTNGPFSVESRGPGGMELIRSPYYWDRWNVALERIELVFDLSSADATAALNRGELDWSVQADFEQLDDPGIAQIAPLFATSYLFFRSDEAPWSDFRVRKGLAMLVPWKSIREATTPFATDTLVPALGIYPKVDGLAEADIGAGLRLLEAAGYPRGRGLPEIVILVVSGSIADGAAREIKKVWEQALEVQVVVRGVSFREYQRIVASGGFALGSSTWIGDFADPLSFLQMWTGTSNLNDARYRDEVYDDLVAAGMREVGEKRLESLSRAERRLLVDEAVVLPLSHTLSVNFVDLERIGGWYPNALDVHPLKGLRFRTPPVPKWYARLMHSIRDSAPA